MRKADFKCYALILVFSFSASISMAAKKYSVAVFENDKTAENLLSALKIHYKTDSVSYQNFNSINRYDCIIISDSQKLSDIEQKKLLSFLKAGKDLVLLGGKDVNLPQLPVFERRDIYYYENAPEIILYDQQNTIKSDFNLKGTFSGLSAIAFEYPEVSRFIPLLIVKDKYSRNKGVAAGLLVNYAGKFKNSNCVLFGIDSDEFYKSKEFVSFTLDIIDKIKTKTLAAELKKEDIANKKKCLPVASPAPAGFIRLCDDKKHFIYPNRKKFFALGCNYIGPFERKTEYGEDYYNVERLEQDFRKAKEAGINSFRFWNVRIDQYPERFKTVIELARKYQIYLILQPREHPLATDKKQIQLFQRNASVVNNETIVLGYDLMNEPYITMVGSTSVNGRKTEILKHKVYDDYSEKYFDKEWVDYAAKNPGWPEIGTWIRGKDVKNLYAAHSMLRNYIEKYNPSVDYSCLYGLNGELPVEPEYEEFLTAVDKTFADWILFHKKAIEQFGNKHFISVGYNTALAALPCNNLLDFASHHIYQMPYTYEDVIKAVTTFDRLRAFWPDKPITLGEFGFSSGLKMPNEKYLGPDAASVAEMIVYLYAFANDYSGAYLWMLSEWPLANMRYNAHWISDDRRVYESQFGMFYYDGTPQGHPKPIAYATRFFRDYIDSHNPGDGELNIIHADTPMKTGYVFTDKDALFVGNTKYASRCLSFSSEKPVNVMLTWDSNHLKIMATRDVEVNLNAAIFGFSKYFVNADGVYDSLQKSGDSVNIKLLEGNVVTFTGKKK